MPVYRPPCPVTGGERTVMVSAAHSNCGRRIDGDSELTRELTPMYIRGATKWMAGRFSAKMFCTWSKSRLRSAGATLAVIWCIRSSICFSHSVAGVAWPMFQMCPEPELSQKSGDMAGAKLLDEKKKKIDSKSPLSMRSMRAPCSRATTSTAMPIGRRSSRSTVAERSSEVLPRKVSNVNRASVPFSSSSHSSASRLARPRPASSALARSTEKL